MIFKELIKNIINDNKITDNEKVLLIKDIIGGKEYKEDFEIFWNMYLGIGFKTKDLGIPKKQAFERFNNIINSGVSPSKILQGLKNYLKTNISDKQYVIRPRRFLRDKIWELYINDNKEKKKWTCPYGNTHLLGKECNCE